jgi:hypothetical protein
MEQGPGRTRLDRGMDRVVALGRRASVYGRDLVKNPVRLLVMAVCLVLFAMAIPLLIGGGSRLEAAWSDWRHERSVGRDWTRGTGHLTEVRSNDGITLHLFYFDRSGDRRTATVHLDGTGDEWVRRLFPIRYDPAHKSQVDLVNISEADSLGRALVAGAAIGAGLAALLLSLMLWRRRRAIAEAEHPLALLRVPLAISGFVLALGVAAWAVGTVRLRGWTGVADRLGNQLSVAFGDMLGVTVPLVTFAIGCLLTAWLARHRHHDEHEGVLSNVHRIIDRAAGYVPSPEDLKAELPDELTGAIEPPVTPDAPAPEVHGTDGPTSESDRPGPPVEDTDEVIRTGR